MYIYKMNMLMFKPSRYTLCGCLLRKENGSLVILKSMFESPYGKINVTFLK